MQKLYPNWRIYWGLVAFGGGIGCSAAPNAEWHHGYSMSSLTQSIVAAILMGIGALLLSLSE